MSKCPDKPTLQQYLLGRISEPLSDSVELHLAECKVCDGTLAMLDDTADSLLRHLPLAANEMQSPVNNDQQPKWLQRLKGGPPVAIDAVSAAVDAQLPLQGLESYELLDVLGRGGMGVVYRGRHRQLDRNVAIKIVSPRLVTAGDAAQRFDREIAILGKLQHPGIVMATDAGRVKEAAYLVMELIDGCDLAKLVRRQGPLAVAEACEVARQIAEALAAAHAAGAIHRDVKPSNVMLDRSGRAKLLDFGLARASDIQDHQRETSIGRLLGTLDYMAPEQASGNTVGDAADLFGLGATLFFLLTGRPPRSEDREQTVLQQLQCIANDEAPELQQLRADIPDKLNSLVSRLLSRQPEDRPESASAVAEQLQAFADPAAVQTVANNIPADEPRRDDAVVAQSLSELLGDDILVGMSAATSPPATPASNGRSGRRSIVRWLIGLGGIIAACYGIVFLLDTPEGTLRIESESADIQVELLDEKDQVQKLQIKGGEKETVLKAGRYRIRLAGNHDAMTVSPKNVELTKNGEQVVRITYVKPTAEKSKSGSPEKFDPNQPLYEGLTRGVWQQRFNAESNPHAKVEAAKALVTLSRKLPTKDQAMLLTSIGDKVLTDTEGRNWFDSTDVRLSQRRFVLTKWNGNIYKGIRDEWMSLLQLMSLELRNRPAAELARAFTEITQAGPDGNAAFVVHLLRDYQLKAYFAADAQAAHAIITSATAKQQTIGRVLFMVRSQYAEAADQRDLFIDEFNSTGRELSEADNELRDDMFAFNWLTTASKLKPDPQVWANVSFRYMLHNDGMSLPIQQADVRRAWTNTAVEWLKKNPTDNSGGTVSIIDQLISYLHVADSGWPLAEVRRLMTSRVEQKYVASIIRPTDVAPGQIGKQCTLEDYLTLLIIAGGELPECTLTGKPPVSAAERLEVLAECVKRKQSMNGFKKFCADRKLAQLVSDAPVETIRLVMEHAPFAERADMMWYLSTLMSSQLADDNAKNASGVDDDGPSVPPVHPLLLIAIATELSGTSIERDDHICELLFCRCNSNPRPYDRRYSLLKQESQQAQDVATKWLRRMRDKTSHKLLLTEIDEWLPGEKQARRLVAEADSRSLEAALRTYNKQTELQRLNLFDPPIPDLTLKQLREGLKATEEAYQAQGKSEVSLSLRETIATGSFKERGYFDWSRDDTEDNSGDDFEIVPKAYISTPNTAGQVGEFVFIESLTLSYNHKGYSSRAYGDIRSPIEGTWVLVRAARGAVVYEDERLQNWLMAQPGDRQLNIHNDKITFPFMVLENPNETPTFALSLDYAGGIPRMTVTADKVILDGRFASEEFVDHTELTIMLSPDRAKDPTPIQVDSVTIVLKYKRVQKANDKADDKASVSIPTDSPPVRMPSETTVSDTAKTKTEFPASPEFPPVKIRVVDEDGKPVQRAEVRLSLRHQKGQQPIKVVKVSDENGNSVDRILPYGSYFIGVKTTDNWSASLLNYDIEFGKGLDLTVISPTARKSATLTIDANLNFSDEVRKQLRFGEYRYERGQGAFKIYAPEPQQPTEDFESFPTMANGIDKVAVKLLILGKRDIPQNDKSVLTWARLINPDMPKTKLWVSNDDIRTVEDVKQLKASPENKSGLFIVNRGCYVGCSSIKSTDTKTVPHSIEVPSGILEIQLIGIAGRPNAEALKSLQLSPQEGREVWLGINLHMDFNKDSKWVPNLFNTTGWKPGERGRFPRPLLIKNVVAAPNKTVNINLLTP